MNRMKETFVLGFAIFAAFFGAGNLILPPMLGFKAGSDWLMVTLGFLFSATVIPLIALFGHAKLQGTMIDFGKKVSDRFGLIFSTFVYIIIIILPAPRTAAVTHEMAISPFFGSSPLMTSSIYFTLVFLFVINRGVVIDIIGKYLTPIIGCILLGIIFLGILGPSSADHIGGVDAPFVYGFLEGYQTYDAIAGLVMGGIVVITINNLKKDLSDHDKQIMLRRSGLIAMLGLFIFYIGLIYIGAKFNSDFDPTISRTALLSGLSAAAMGNIGSSFLSILVAVACFTTAISIVMGTADFFKGRFGESQKVYRIVAALSCISGVVMGQFEVKLIIDLAVYALMFLYPISMVLILLNILPDKYASGQVFRWVVGVAFIFSIPDFLKFLISPENLEGIYGLIPFSRNGLGWVLPSLLAFILTNLITLSTRDKSTDIA